jgi:hypothetical protein
LGGRFLPLNTPRPSRPVQHSAALSGMVATKRYTLFLHLSFGCA